MSIPTRWMVLLFAAVSAGCEPHRVLPTADWPPESVSRRLPSEGVPDSGRPMMPLLTAGNRWVYGEWSSGVVFVLGHTPEASGACAIREDVIAGFETRGGRYCARVESESRRDSVLVRTVQWLRADDSGLHEVGVPHPREGAAPGAPWGERQLLAFPLEVGARWIRDPALGTTAEVTGREFVAAPGGRQLAWRIQVGGGLTAPDLVSWEWWSDVGLLGVETQHRSGNPGRASRWTRSAWGARLRSSDLQRPLPCERLVAEAREVLGSVVTGEQVYFQRWGQYRALADTDDLLAILGVDLSSVLPRWAVSVGAIEPDGFTATARGRTLSTAEGVVVVLRHQRLAPPVWTVRGCPAERAAQ